MGTVRSCGIAAALLAAAVAAADEGTNLTLAGQITRVPSMSAERPVTAFLDDDTTATTDYLAWLDGRLGNGWRDPANFPIVSYIDSGLDNGRPVSPAFDEFYLFGDRSRPSRIAFNFDYNWESAEVPAPTDTFPYEEFIRPATGDLIFAGHGTGTALALSGYPAAKDQPHEPSGYRMGLGISPFGRVAMAGMRTPFPEADRKGEFPTQLQPEDILRAVGESHRRAFWIDEDPAQLDTREDIARGQTLISNNSFVINRSGDQFVPFDYDRYAQMYDKLARDGRPAQWYPNTRDGGRAQILFVAAAGNAGINCVGFLNDCYHYENDCREVRMDSIVVPGFAKNVLTVGGSESFDYARYKYMVPMFFYHVRDGRYEEIPFTLDFSATHDIGGEPCESAPPPDHPALVVATALEGDATTAGSEFVVTLYAKSNTTGATPTHFNIRVDYVEPFVELTDVEPGDYGPVLHDEFPWITLVSGASDALTTDTPVFCKLHFRVRDPLPAGFGPYFIKYELFHHADDIRDQYVLASKGMASDSVPPLTRIKPDVVAPSTRVYQRKYPEGYMAAADGTSQGTALVSGMAQLSSYFIRRTYGREDLSPALLKAYIINTANPLTGTIPAPDGTIPGPIPNAWQGFGRVDLDRALDPAARTLIDQTEVLREGDVRTWTATVADAERPVRATLVWTDAAAELPAPRWQELVNNLDLMLHAELPDGTSATYLGNNFNMQHSSVEIAHAFNADNPWNAVNESRIDRANNVECIFLPPLPQGTKLTISVRAGNVSLDALQPFAPLEEQTPRQDFALVLYNAETAQEKAARMLLRKTEPTISGDVNGDGFLDAADLVP